MDVPACGRVVAFELSCRITVVEDLIVHPRVQPR